MFLRTPEKCFLFHRKNIYFTTLKQQGLSYKKNAHPSMSTSYLSDSFLQNIPMAILAVTNQNTPVNKYIAVASTCQVNHGVIKLVFRISVSIYSEEMEKIKNTRLSTLNIAKNTF